VSRVDHGTFNKSPRTASGGNQQRQSERFQSLFYQMKNLVYTSRRGFGRDITGGSVRTSGESQREDAAGAQ
jgi:hypothetical protein